MHNLPVIVIIIIVIGLLVFVFNLGIEKQLTRSCIIWAEQEKNFPLFELEEELVKSCGLQGIIIK